MKKNFSLPVGNYKSISLILVSFIFAALLFTSCSKEDSVTPDQPNPAMGKSDGVPVQPTTVFIYIYHGKCESCQAYSVTVYKNGRVLYDGIANVDVLGETEFTISPAAINQLRSVMTINGFFSLNDYYPYSYGNGKNYTALHDALPDGGIATGQSGQSGVNFFEFDKQVVDYGIRVPAALNMIRGTIEHDLGVDVLVGRPTSDGITLVHDKNE